MWAAPVLATVTLGVALVDRVELLLAVRRALEEEEEVLDVDIVVVALAGRVEIEMEELGREMDAEEVGTWTCPSEICVTGTPLVADAEPDAEVEAALEVMLAAAEEEAEEGPAAFEIPNCVEYWY